MTQEIQRNSNQNLTLKERLEIRKNSSVLLLDISGSMSYDLEPGHRKIDALQDIVKSLKTKPIIYTFSSGVQLADMTNPMVPTGGTRLGHALEYLKDKGHKKVVVITDGMVDDPGLCLELVNYFSLQVLYVGLGDPPEFLEKLAKMGGNFCTKEDLSKPKELTGKIQLLLGEGKSSSICL
jgi:predicted metal-dependent peptidase